MATYTADQVKDELKDVIGDDEKLLKECLAMCTNFKLTPNDLRWKLEALNFRPSTTRSEISPITLDSILALKAQMQRDITRQKKAQPRTTVSANVSRMRMPAAFNRNVPLPGMAKPGAGPVPGRSVVAQAKQEEVQVAGPSHVVFSGLKMDEEAKKQRVYRYMFEKQMERSENLDQIIDDAAELVKKYYKLDDIGDPGTTTDDDIAIVGRIFQDVEVESGKLTDASVFLESSRVLSGGARIALKFDPTLVIRNNIRGARGLGLFPGAIVAAKGRNGGGGYFLVKEILTLPVPSSTLPTPAANTMKVDPVDASAFSLAIACGPFTADSDLDYAPLASIVETLQKDKPSAVLLVGPFIDAAHPLIKVGDLDEMPSELFHQKIYRPLRTFLDASPGSIAILLPGVRDLVSNHAVYPQSELMPDLVKNDPRIHLVPNPARFKINDILFGVCSVDVLFHLRREELVKAGREVDPVMPVHEDDVGTDAMAALCRHLLQQRSFYPIFPTPHELAHEVNLDVSHSDGLKLVDEGDPSPPDVLVLPSKLKHFIKMVHSTTAINPSFLNRGTYALLKVAEGGNASSVKQRLDCEIARLSK
ncbi:alpha DNA polymerase [Macrolepiota fuliginosa MF-IS2]|uniref:DNA polymerase alpha subunit B n=1 Tax=Macrolepiota fuliginosa MF-IS2 TaxID=1400762 RepID=A0A9P6C7J2_9AGAR|nr:alpha DNA polymerase [Macrolepiota fuliginosa MF-IS2]